MAKSLLEKAKDKPSAKNLPKSTVTEEEVDLLLEWLSGNITTGQFAYAFGYETGNQGYTKATTILRAGIAQKLIRVEKVVPKVKKVKKDKESPESQEEL